MSCEFHEDRSDTRFVQRTPAHPRGIGRAAHEYGMAFTLAQLRAGTGAPIHATSVWFAHARPGDIAPLARFFGTSELAFGSESSGFTLSRAVLAAPMRSGDPRLLATARDLAEASMRDQPRTGTIATRVEEKLRADLASGADVAVVARGLGMSVRTLQRRLEEEGLTFSDAVDRVREERARAWLLEPSLSLAEIASRLGFADLATFSRAFKRWTGKPPGTWRRSTIA
jgi:AraC-like DNA-binding protein